MGRSFRGGVRLNRRNMTDLVTDWFRDNQDSSISVKRLCDELRLKTHPMRSMCMDIVMDLLEDGFLKEKDGQFQLMQKSKYMEGVLQRRVGGKNFLVPDDGGEPVFVAERNSAGAVNGDRVKVVLFARRPHSGPEGEVTEIIRRAKDTFVGTLQVKGKFAYLVTPDKSDRDIFIPLSSLKKGRDGEKAVVKVVEWPDTPDRNPVGKVIDILGAAGENNTEMHAILAEYGLPYSYPENVEQAAEQISSEITDAALAGREDFRDVVTFTIDPHDAKDFDDALSIRPIKKGLWEVGVHIADVSYYVQEGSIIDKEAYKRATSVYLVDRTIPMLPENQPCERNPFVTLNTKYRMKTKIKCKGIGPAVFSLLLMTNVACGQESGSADGPYVWKNVQIVGGGFCDGIIFHPKARDVRYARTDMGGAYRWDRKADRWVPMLDFISYADNNLVGVESIAVDPNDKNT